MCFFHLPHSKFYACKLLHFPTNLLEHKKQHNVMKYIKSEINKNATQETSICELYFVTSICTAMKERKATNHPMEKMDPILERGN